MHYCGNCGAGVAATARSCPNCHVIFGEGTGQGSSAAQLKKQQEYRASVAAGRRRERRHRRQERRADRIRGSHRKWLRITKRNKDALQLLAAFCVAVQHDFYHRQVGGSPHHVDPRVSWLLTSPPNRDPRNSPYFSPNWKQILVGPRGLKYPTRKAIRYLEGRTLEAECRREMSGRWDLDLETMRLKEELDRVT